MRSTLRRASRRGASRCGVRRRAGAGGMQTAFRAVLEGGRPGRTSGSSRSTTRCPRWRTTARSGRRTRAATGRSPARSSPPRRRSPSARRARGLDRRDRLPVRRDPRPRNRCARGGKLLSLEAGLWNGVDAVLYCHPEFLDTVNLQSLWMRRDRLVVAGARSLRADAVQEPLVALRALLAATESLPAGQAHARARGVRR